MDEFFLYLQLGTDHILDLTAFDHLLFVVTLCAAYHWRDWRQVLILVTAFTIGHSITLVLAGLDLIPIPAAVVEFLIPVTILVTSIHNLTVNKADLTKQRVTYAIALFFGLIHGMGFSNYFRTLMGSSEAVVKPLFAFNIGIELGQLVIVAFLFAAYFLLSKVIRFEHRDWRTYLSGAGGGVALVLILEQLV